MSLIQLPLKVAERLHDVQVHLWQLTESVEVLQKLQPDSSILYQAPYVTFKADSRRREWLAVRVLLAQVVSVPVTIDYEISGKPFLVPRIAEFSVSHTKDLVALALSSLPTGVDVEQIGERAYRLRDYFLQGDEVSLPDEEGDEVMAVLMWSAKESVYKLCGKPGLELKAGIQLRLQCHESDYVQFMAKVKGFSQRIMVKGFIMGNDVLTVAQMEA